LEGGEQMCDEIARNWMKETRTGKEDGAEQAQGNGNDHEGQKENVNGETQ
jgi:hypothetical protein